MSTFFANHGYNRPEPRPAAAMTVTYSCGHVGTLTTAGQVEGAVTAPNACPTCEPPETVKALDMFGETHDTGRSESALNGWTDGATAELGKPERWNAVCICGHGPTVHQYGFCDRCNMRNCRHAFQRVTTEPLFVAPGGLL